MKDKIGIFFIFAIVAIFIYGTRYLLDAKCYVVSIDASRDDMHAHFDMTVPAKKYVDPALRQMQALVPKSMDITQVRTYGEGREWFCHD